MWSDTLKNQEKQDLPSCRTLIDLIEFFQQFVITEIFSKKVDVIYIAFDCFLS